MKRKKAQVNSLLLLALALLVPILQGCSSAAVQASPQAMEGPPDASQQDEVRG